MNRFVFIILLLLLPGSALANWTLNIGYHNPPIATFGVNFLYFSSDWAFELGIGWLDGDITGEDNSSNQNEEETSIRASAAGSLNFKKFFASGSFRPYLQLGIGAGIGVQAGDSGGFGAGVGGVYGGGGVMIGGPSLYLYGSYNLASNYTFAQFGLGFDI